MSVWDKVRSFAESRNRDDEIVRNGFTFGDMRLLVKQLSYDQETAKEAYDCLLEVRGVPITEVQPLIDQAIACLEESIIRSVICESDPHAGC